MSLVSTFACSHTGLMVTREMEADTIQRGAVRNAFATLAESIHQDRPDALVIIGTDHGRIYTWQQMPQIMVGVSSEAQGLGDAGLPAVAVGIDQAAAQHVLEALLAGNIDAGYSEMMRIDHSFVAPLLWITPDLHIPIIPIAINCGGRPLMRLSRCIEIGLTLGRALREMSGRYTVLGTGGLSHWVGSAERRAALAGPAGTRITAEIPPLNLEATGPINSDFDREFLAALQTGNVSGFADTWNTDRLEAVAGDGAQEVRMWLIAAAAAAPAKAAVICYEPVPEWLTGIGIVEFVNAS